MEMTKINENQPETSVVQSEPNEGNKGRQRKVTAADKAGGAAAHTCSRWSGSIRLLQRGGRVRGYLLNCCSGCLQVCCGGG